MYNLVVPPESPCPCGSGKAFGKCHLSNGTVVFPEARIQPPPPRTGLPLHRCYFSPLKDCRKPISGDHIISRAVLSSFPGREVRLSSPTRTIQAGIDSDSIKTKWLCKRHNESLSPLDQVAGRLIRSIENGFRVIEGHTGNSQPLSLFNGHDVERWMLKTTLATYFAKLSNVNRESFRLPRWWLSAFSRVLPAPFGLYVATKESDGQPKAMTVQPGAQVALVTQGDIVGGVRLSLHGLELVLFASPTAPTPHEHFAHRPDFVNLLEGQTVVSFGFVWGKSGGQTIWLSKAGPGAPPPSN